MVELPAMCYILLSEIPLKAHDFSFVVSSKDTVRLIKAVGQIQFRKHHLYDVNSSYILQFKVQQSLSKIV